MRKWLFILFAAITLSVNGQTCDYISFRLSNDGCYGCSSFYWGVDYVGNLKGVHYFELCFYSNSYYLQGGWASTYVEGIRIYVEGIEITEFPQWAAFKDKTCPEAFIFYTYARYPKVGITWTAHNLL